ncbi:hypothetical protein WDZ17_05275, partial [Pseudokineococcus basanitobsidens]
PFFFPPPPPRARATAAGLGGLVLLLTAARTAALALAVVLLVLALARALQELRGGRGPSRPLLTGVVAATAGSAAGLWLVATAAPTDWSNRGLVWLRARDVVSDHLLVGAGLSQWSALQDVGVLSTHFTHSLYLYLLFAGGAVGVGLFSFTAASLLRAHLGAGWWTTAPVLLLLVAGLFESVWNPMTVDATTWAVVALLAAVPAAAAGGPRRGSADVGSAAPATAKA